MCPRLIKFIPMAIASSMLVITTGCSPVNAENHPPASKDNPTATTTAQQTPAKKSEAENSIWVRFAKPTCH